MRKRLLLYCLAVILSVAAVGCEEETSFQREGETVEVVLNLSAEIPETRADRPMFSKNENPIYNLWLLQFDKEGIITGKPQYSDFADGVLSIKDLKAELRAGQSTVCLVANLGKDFKFEVDGRAVDNVTVFRSMLIDAPLISGEGIAADSVGHLKDRSMYMYGYYQGDIKSGASLNVLLGRLFLRINLILENSTGKDLEDMEITISNVPAKTRIPFVNESSAGKFIEYKEKIPAPVAAGASTMHYYYMPENISPSEDKATKVTVTTSGGEASILLGNDSPVIEKRSYTLNRNNIYTFRINLK